MAAGTGWKMLAVLACGLVGIAGGTRAGAAETKDDAVDAEMLKDLDLLSEVEVANDRELLQRLRFWERFRLLERLRYLEEEEKK
ncbi:MAG: hypothetical protein HYY64_15060 [Candidatus Rokubacteria bacterium]|nr:hypothetical protein [Candidatus Rokubacteria bacterium]